MIQLQVLNHILNTKDFSMVIVNNLTEDFFCDYKNEFNFIKNHVETYGNVPDKASVLAKFPDFDIIQVYDSPEFLLDELYKDKQVRDLAETFNTVRDLVLSGKVDEAMQYYANHSSLSTAGKRLSSVDILSDTSRYNSYVDRCNDFNKYYVSTGFKELDMVIGGWDRQEELATIVARPNIGKTWILLKCAISAMKSGLNVGIYSGEMSVNKVGYRVDTLLSHISNTSITKGNASVQNEYKVFLDNLKSNYARELRVLTPELINGPAGVTALKAFIEKDSLDILFIDQHSLLEDDRKAKNPVEKAANISKDLKNLQVLAKIPIIAVSQQNRASTDDGVNLTNIAQTDRIGQDSTIVIFIEKKDDIIKLELLKSRDSVNNKAIKYAVDFDKGIFTYIPEESNATDGAGVAELIDEFEDFGEDVF